MNGFIVHATVEKDVAANLFYTLSGIAYGKNLSVRTITKSTAPSTKTFRMDVRGSANELAIALQETEALVTTTKSSVSSGANQLSNVKVELTVL